MIKYKYLLLIILYWSNQITYGQNKKSVATSIENSKVTESVYIHTNTNTLVTGETLFFQFYLLDRQENFFSTISKIGYIELIDQNQKNHLKQKIILNNGIGSGDFFIGTTFKTGIYKLVGYTLWGLNNPEKSVFQKEIAIINPFEETLNKDVIVAKQPQKTIASHSIESNTSTGTSSLLSLKTDKQNYTKREKVNLSFETGNYETEGAFSLSVRKLDSLQPLSNNINPIIYKANLHAIKDTENPTRNYLPELRGEIISGKIISKNNAASIENVVIALSLPGTNFTFKVVKTDANGNFSFILNNTYSAQDAVVQVMAENRNEYLLTLDRAVDFITLSAPVKFTQQLFLSPNIKKFIEERSLASQIENNYYESKKDSLLPYSKTPPFFHPMEKNYILDDYTRFPSLKETIVEIIPELFYSNKNGKYSIHVRDYDVQSGSLGEALILVDGLLIQNINELFEYDTQNIYKISLVNKSYIYGPKIFNGIVNITTKMADYTAKDSGDFLKKETLYRPLPAKKNFTPDYALYPQKRIPDYRYQLLWLPGINSLKNDKEISFYTSDISGTFQILLEGFTKKGEPILIEKKITVE